MRNPGKQTHIMTSAGLWACAGTIELFMQWRLLSPPLVDFFGTGLVFGIVGVYAFAGGLLGLLAAWVVPWSRVRLPLLVFIPLFLAALGIFASRGGVVSVNGLLALTTAVGATMLTLKSPFLRRLGTAAGFVIVVPVAMGLLLKDHGDSNVAGEKNRRDEPALNVVLITIDTLRPDHLRLLGYSRRTSPSLDSLAARGVIFTETYAPMPCTAPSHASIMTGRYPRNHGVLRNGWSLPRGMRTLAEAFRDAGYRTGAFVGVAHLAAAFGWGRGFERYADQGWYDQLFPYSGLRLVRTAIRCLSASFSRRAAAVVDDALIWLANASDEPFFIWLHLWDPHDPYAPPAADQASFEEPAGIPEGTAYAAERVTRWINGYDGEIHYVDRELERFWRALREQRLAENTVIFVLSDHGESLGERSFRGHSIFLYEEQIKTLCFCVLPPDRGVMNGRIDAPISLVDVAPTLLDIAGIDVDLGRTDGESLVPLLQGSKIRQRPVLLEANMWGFVAQGVRFGGKKLIIHRQLNPKHRGFASRINPEFFSRRLELFDLESDPREEVNLAAVFPDTVAMLETLLRRTRLATPDADIDSVVSASTVDALRALGYLD